MKKEIVAIPIGIGIIAITIIAIFATYQESDTIEVKDTFDAELRSDETSSPEQREWITSGPFQIDKSQYVLGEKIFLRVEGLTYDEKGQVAFMRPLNDTHYSVYLALPFDGANKNTFNHYIDPQISKSRGLCSIDDVLGKWVVVFRGTDHSNLSFEIIDEFVPGEESNFEPIC